jgi:hypothetical protein
MNSSQPCAFQFSTSLNVSATHEAGLGAVDWKPLLNTCTSGHPLVVFSTFFSGSTLQAICAAAVASSICLPFMGCTAASSSPAWGVSWGVVCGDTPTWGCPAVNFRGCVCHAPRHSTCYTFPLSPLMSADFAQGSALSAGGRVRYQVSTFLWSTPQRGFFFV